MTDNRRITGEVLADISHAILVRSISAAGIQGMSAPDGGPLYMLSLGGPCRCRRDSAELERTMLLRDEDLVSVIAALTDLARQTRLGHSLDELVETVIQAVRDRLGDRAGRDGQLISVCSKCGVGTGPCDCAGWTAGPGDG